MNKFSIIMPAYNAEATIKLSIESVLGQTYPAWDLHVIDDCSIDSTAEIVQAYATLDRRIKYYRLPRNSGVAEARNYALSLIDGDFIAFLDSDDVWNLNKLKIQLPFLTSGYPVVCSDFNYFYDDPSNIIRSSNKKEFFGYEDMLKGNNIGNLTGVYSKETIGVIKQKKIGHEDYAMWLEVMALSRKGYCIKEPLASYRLSNASLSSNKIKAALWQWDILRNHADLSFFLAIYYFAFYFYNAIFGRIKRL